MREEEIEMFRKHIGKARELKLKNEQGGEDTFIFKPLGVEFLPDIMSLAASMQLNKEEEVEAKELKRKLKADEITEDQYEEDLNSLQEKASMRGLSGPSAKKLVDLIDAMVKQSYPELEEDIRFKFIYANILPLQNTFMELNEGFNKDNPELINKIEEMRRRVRRR